MAEFPLAIPSIAEIPPGQTLAQAQHRIKHNQIASEIAALATRIGTTNSTDPTSLTKQVADIQTTVSNLGAGFGSNTNYFGETPTGAVDGTNKSYTTALPYVAGSLRVYVNGTRRISGVDYTAVAGGFTMTNALAVGSKLRVDYATSTSEQGNAQTIGGLSKEAFETSVTNNVMANVMAKVYPVGSIYTQAEVATNPATLLGFGTWTAFGAGRVLVGVNASEVEFDTLGETGGAKTVTLTESQMPSHLHGAHHFNSSYQSVVPGTGGAFAALNGSSYSHNANTTSTGGGAAHNNLQPYVTVHMWRRTA